jgi:hypothetical protein
LQSTTMGTALLALLALKGVPLEAQADPLPADGLQERAATMQLEGHEGNYSLRTPDFGFTFDAQMTSTAAALEHPTRDDNPRQGSKKHASDETSRDSTRSDFNKNIYYKNKLECSLEMGVLPVNIPFVFDFLLGGGYIRPPLHYTLVPIIASLRWQMDDVGGPWILRGNWDATFSGSFTVIPRGPETRYWAYLMGIRRNFVQPNWRIGPYFEGRLGIGNIDAKGPDGVFYAQGQDLTFTLMLGSGVRYNLNPRYAISVGIGYMHISNLYLSEPKFLNYGINVYGPTVGVDVQLGKHQRHSAQ